MRKMCRPHIVSSGRHRYLYEQCGPDADCREHVQTGGLDDCLEHARTYQRSLQTLHPTTPQCLTNYSRRLSVFDAKLSVHRALGRLYFLRETYRIRSDCVGDQICIFGFSRGAFTARALAGMLQKVGLLPPCNREQLPFAYKMYARDDEEGCRLSVQFKRTFSIDVRIKFLGVWYVIRHIDQPPTLYLRAGIPYNLLA